MARFGDNPIKPVLAGNELIPGTDPSSNDDLCTTPAILATYMANNLPLSNATGNGLMSDVEFNRIYDTYTKEQIDAKNAILKQEAVGFFIGTVANGYIEFFKNPVNDMTLRQAFFGLASGTVTCTVQIDGINVAGLTAIALTSAGQAAMATSANFLGTSHRLGLLFASNATALGFYISIYADASIP